MKCPKDCWGWNIGWGQIIAAQTFCALQTAGPKYTGPIVEFCPWCGERLVKHVKNEGEDMEPCACEDCGTPYETLGLDVVLPDDQWEMIRPGGGDILCGTCIAKRAEKLFRAIVIKAYIEFGSVGIGLGE